MITFHFYLSINQSIVLNHFISRATPTPQAPSGTGLKQPTTPPRPMTARTWAATVPTILSHAAFTKLCSPAPVLTSVRRGPPVMLSPLERFLCCMQLKRHLTRVIQSEDAADKKVRRCCYYYLIFVLCRYFFLGGGGGVEYTKSPTEREFCLNIYLRGPSFFLLDRGGKNEDP